MKEGFSKYFENVIALRDMLAFSCENKDDIQTLFGYLRAEQKLNVNIIHTRPVRSLEFSSPSISQLSKFGFNHFLLELVDGPLPILNYLCSTYRLHTVPIGNDHTLSVAEKVPPEYSLFFTRKLIMSPGQFLQLNWSWRHHLLQPTIVSIQLHHNTANKDRQSLKKSVDAIYSTLPLIMAPWRILRCSKILHLHYSRCWGVALHYCLQTWRDDPFIGQMSQRAMQNRSWDQRVWSENQRFGHAKRSNRFQLLQCGNVQAKFAATDNTSAAFASERNRWVNFESAQHSQRQTLSVSLSDLDKENETFKKKTATILKSLTEIQKHKLDAMNKLCVAENAMDYHRKKQRIFLRSTAELEHRIQEAQEKLNTAIVSCLVQSVRSSCG